MFDALRSWFGGPEPVPAEENPYAPPHSPVKMKPIALRGPISPQTLEEYRAIVRSWAQKSSTDSVPGRFPQQRLLMMEEFFRRASAESGPIEIIASEGNLLPLLPYVLLGEYADMVRSEAVCLLVPSMERNVRLHPAITDTIADIRQRILGKPIALHDCVIADPASILLTNAAVPGTQAEEIPTRLCFNDPQRFEELGKYINLLKAHAQPYRR